MTQLLTLPVGTLIKATGKIGGMPIVSGKIIGVTLYYYIVQGSDGVKYYVQPTYFKIEEVKP